MLDISRFLHPSISYLCHADDLKIYPTVRDISDRDLLQAVCDGVVKWCSLNNMVLSPSENVVLAADAWLLLMPGLLNQ